MNSDFVRAERPYFINSGISSHLRAMNYKGNILSLEKCGQPNGGILQANCECGKSDDLFDMPWRCDSRICPNCSNRRKWRIKKHLLPLLEKEKICSQQSHNIMSAGLRFITISPKNCQNLKGGNTRIRSDFNKFIRRKYIKERVKGSIYIIEDKMGNDDLWNVHIHAIIKSKYLDNRARGNCLDCGQNLLKYNKEDGKYYCANKKCNSKNIILKSYSRIQEEWKSSAGTDAQIYITEITSYDHLVNYLLKYISSNKGDFKTDEQVAQYLVDTYKKRLITTSGCFYGIVIARNKDEKFCYYCKSIIKYGVYIPREEDQINIKHPPDLCDFGGY